MVPADRRRLDVLVEPRHRPRRGACRPAGRATVDTLRDAAPDHPCRRRGPPFRHTSGVRELDEAEYDKVKAAFEAYQDTIPKSKKFREIAYDVKDIVGRTGFGIGSAGLPSYNVLIEGFNQALDNDIVLSMKQGNVAAAEPGRRRRGRAQVLQAPGAPHRGVAAGAAGARRPAARLHRASTGSVTSSRSSRRTSPTSTGAR